MRSFIIYTITISILISTLVSAQQNRRRAIGKRSHHYNEQIKTTRKPLFGLAPEYEDENQYYKSSEVQQKAGYNYKYYNNDDDKDYYFESKKSLSSNNAGGSSSSSSVLSSLSLNVRKQEDKQEKTQPPSFPVFKDETAVKPTKSEQPPPVETAYKEGTATAGDSTPYGFTDGGAGSAGYIINGKQQAAAGRPFVNNGDDQAAELDDRYRFHGAGYQTNSVSNTMRGKVLKNCDNEEHAQYYCSKLNDGRYFDPWNPWCGYIYCENYITYRKNCQRGTWMGLELAMKYPIKKMCRKRLPQRVAFGDSAEACPLFTDFDLCKNTQDQAAKAEVPSSAGAADSTQVNTEGVATDDTSP